MKKTLYSLMLSDDVVREVDALAHRPSALSKVIAQKEKPYISIMASLILSVVNNTCLILIFLFFIPRLSVMIFQRGDMELLLKAMIAMIPMVTLSGILKGILQGQQHHATACASQIFEEIFRIIYLILFFQNGFIKNCLLCLEPAVFFYASRLDNRYSAQMCSG